MKSNFHNNSCQFGLPRNKRLRYCADQCTIVCIKHSKAASGTEGGFAVQMSMEEK